MTRSDLVARLAERLRDNARKLCLYAKLAKAMQLEIENFVQQQAQAKRG